MHHEVMGLAVWLVQSYIYLRHQALLERFYDLTMYKTFLKMRLM